MPPRLRIHRSADAGSACDRGDRGRTLQVAEGDRVSLSQGHGDLDALPESPAGARRAQLLLRVLTGIPAGGPPATEFDGLLDALLDGAAR
ncbi:hypothetical protein K875_05547 [Mycobacterium [tuberculosis] TKK-01-0051]|uniref:Uncharacterized protein n=1 Tax=Mycobacterium [tuberculosis] TKK-01-0051 TaxID=1324261 RepID=A0A051TJR2_9MYCO|nr:hypothetical protein K875_05547 [Mycobacterium [tuberculosis] TKK-01-0051]